jgi:hypothetical protein
MGCVAAIVAAGINFARAPRPVTLGVGLLIVLVAALNIPLGIAVGLLGERFSRRRVERLFSAGGWLLPSRGADLERGCFARRLTGLTVHDPIRQDPNVCVLERLDRLTAPEAAREKSVDRARDRVEDGIVVAHGRWRCR